MAVFVVIHVIFVTRSIRPLLRQGEWSRLAGTVAMTFFALIFLTFLFSILMEAVVQRTTNLVPSRKGRVVRAEQLLTDEIAGRKRRGPVHV